jgi:hypothetical protein
MRYRQTFGGHQRRVPSFYGRVDSQAGRLGGRPIEYEYALCNYIT